MSLSRYAKKRDGNEREIIDGLEKLGASVEQLDCIDLLVEYPKQSKRFHLLEVKRGKSARLTPAQVAFRRRFTFHVVLCLEDALVAVGILDMRARIERNAREVERKAAAVVESMKRAAEE